MRVSLSVKAMRRLHLHPATYALRRLAALARHKLAGGPPVTRFLLLSDWLVGTSEQQFAPMARHERELREQLGIVFVRRHFHDIERDVVRGIAGFDVIGVKWSFQTAQPEVLEMLQRIRDACRAAGARIVYFDGDDDLAVQWSAVVGMVDLYVKKHAFADRAQYTRGFIGKSNLTEYSARTFGVSFADDPIPCTQPVDTAFLDRLMVGWSIALDDKIWDLQRQLADFGTVTKDIDVCCRGLVPPSRWIHGMRLGAVEALEKLAGRYSVRPARDRVSQEVYYREMLASRACLSPFGYGELCWRDFEAILCGAVLIKPSMEHVATEPALFEPDVTYIPVEWDYSDLGEQCARYLGDPERMQRMADEARRRLVESHSSGWFVERVRVMMQALGTDSR